MSKDPAFLFYSKDWVSKTSELLHEEKGIFIDLLCYQHQNGNLPTDTKRLAKIVGISHEEFIKSWEVLSSKFEAIGTPNGERLVNRMLERVMKERSEKGEANRISGTFAAVLRKADLSKKEYNLIRSQFKIDEFKGIDTERLTERLTEWLHERLKSIGNGNVNGNVNGNDILNGSEEKILEETELHPLQKYIKDKFPTVSKMDIQLTYNNCIKLLEKYNNKQISDTLIAMENYKPLLSKSKNVYLTLLTWLKKQENYKPHQPSTAMNRINMNQ